MLETDLATSYRTDIVTLRVKRSLTRKTVIYDTNGLPYQSALLKLSVSKMFLGGFYVAHWLL